MKTNRFFCFFLLCVLLFTSTVQATDVDNKGSMNLWPEEPEINCKAAVLIDAETEFPIYQKNPHQELYPASTTKVMTALLVLEAVDNGQLRLDQTLTASHSALTTDLQPDGSTAGIVEGEILTVEQYLTCMLLVSANEACNVLAEAVSGSVASFVDAMNAKAKSLGCKNTHFMNTSGLHNEQHYTSAWDLYLIAKAALEHPDFMRICDTKSAEIPETNLHPARTLHSTNSLIDGWRTRGYIYPDAHGIKTGSTSQAGYCLVSSAERGNLHFISVVLGGERVTFPDKEIRTYSFYDTRVLFDWGFENFSRKQVLTSDEVVKEVDVSLAKKADYITVHPSTDVLLILPNELDPSKLKRTLTLPTPVEAPISEGEKLGTMELSYNGKVYTTVDLLAMNDVEASKVLMFLQDVKQFFAKTPVKIACGVVAALLVALLIWKLTIGSQRYRRGQNMRRNNRTIPQRNQRKKTRRK